MKKKYDSWVVAAAVLWRANTELYCDTIADCVVESDLTVLGKRGRTPGQSMCRTLRERRERLIGGKWGLVFRQPKYRGPYTLADRNWVVQHDEVKRAIAELESLEQKQKGGQKDDLAVANEEIERLKVRIGDLEGKIRQIAEICSS
ncbi:MAG: hypothetical protein ABR915_06075 [Thermoguttaceae bacterium]|jgi:hypothetical protein